MTPEQIAAARALVHDLKTKSAVGPGNTIVHMVMTDAASTITAILDALAAAEAELKVTEKLLSDEARQSLDRLERAEAAEARAADLTAKLEAAKEREADLKSSVVAFGGVWAADYAKRAGYAPGELHPTHYDILKDAGARMDDFRRAALKAGGAA